MGFFIICFFIMIKKKKKLLKTDNNSVGKDVKKLELSYIAGGNVKWCSPFGKQLGREFLKKVKHKILYDPEIPLLGIYPREMKAYVHTKTCTYMFIVALFIIAQKWKKPKYPSTGEWVFKMWYV